MLMQDAPIIAHYRGTLFMRAFTWSALAVIVLQRARDVTRVASGRGTQEDGPARVAQTGESEADVTDASAAVGH